MGFFRRQLNYETDAEEIQDRHYETGRDPKTKQRRHRRVILVFEDLRRNTPYFPAIKSTFGRMQSLPTVVGIPHAA